MGQNNLRESEKAPAKKLFKGKEFWQALVFMEEKDTPLRNRAHEKKTKNANFKLTSE